MIMAMAMAIAKMAMAMMKMITMMMKMMKMMKTLQVGESELSACSRRSFHSKSDHPAFVIFTFYIKNFLLLLFSSFLLFLFFCSQDFTWSGFSL